MDKIITAFPIDYDSGDHDFKIHIPTVCPHCGTVFQTEPLTSFYKKPKQSGNASTIYSIYFCSACEKVFMARSIGSNTVNVASLSSILPDGSIHVTSFSDIISDCSPRFVDIYNQSETAEQKGLYEICGMGYRKAIEFLIKDFAISNEPDASDRIEGAKLSQCISEYISEHRIRDLAKASSWIGNDEVHYVRKHEDYSVSDLKQFISVLVSYIESELIIKRAQTLVSNT